MPTIQVFSGIRDLPQEVDLSAVFIIDDKTPQPSDAMLVRSHKLTPASVHADVQAVGRAGVGTDNIPVAAMTARGIPVFNAPGANANAVHELTIAGLLMAARNVPDALTFTLAHAGQEDIAAVTEKGKKQFAGTEVAGKVLGIIGLGAIGSLVARSALALGMTVLGYDTEMSAARALKLPSEMDFATSLDALLEQSDFITLHIPYIAGSHGTRNFIGNEQASKMKEGVILLNFSRPEVVSEKAIVRRLDRGSMRAYVCDFPSPALSTHSDVITLPHLGASTEEAEVGSAAMVITELTDYLEDGNITNAVNFPNLQLARQTAHRLTLAHANKPGVLESVQRLLAKADINIAKNELNTRGDVGYAILELDQMIKPALLVQINGLDTILRARYLN